MVADIEELELMDASEIHAKGLHAGGVLTPMSGEKFIFPVADATVKLSGGDQVLRTSTSIWDWEKAKAIFKENPTDLLEPLQDSSWFDGET